MEIHTAFMKDILISAYFTASSSTSEMWPNHIGTKRFMFNNAHYIPILCQKGGNNLNINQQRGEVCMLQRAVAY